MNILALSQKQKVTAFLIVLTIGFITLAIFTSSGSISIYKTQSKILTLSSGLDNLQGSQVSKAKEDIVSIVAAVNKDISFLNTLGLQSYANELGTSIGDFEAAVNPWLALMQELGFKIDEGKLGELKIACQYY
nr:hypothetical protein [Vibrio hepatarius]